MAIRGNNIVPNNHFRKYWQKYVRTWFNQPGRAKSRRLARQKKVAKIAPRPLGLLRSAVQCTTVRYNFKTRLGRGFTLAELKAAKIPKAKARSIGIAVDHRRKNKCEESLARNVARLAEYQQKLLVLPFKGKAKKGDASKKDVEEATLTTVKTVLPLKKASLRVKSRAITAEDKKVCAYLTLRKARIDKKMFGKRAKRAAEKEALKKDK